MPAAGTFGQMLIDLGINLAPLVAGLDTAKGKVTAFGNEMKNVGTSISGAITGTSQAWAQYSESIKTAQSAIQNIVHSSNQLMMTSMRSILAGGAILALAFFPTKEGAEFEKQMSLVAGITKATSSQMNELREAALQMGRETVFSATQASEAMQILARSGLTVSQIVGVLPSVMYMAAAGQLTIADAARVATESIHAFNLSAVDFAHFTDVMAKASTSANMGISDFSNAMRYVAPMARSAGMSVDETAAAIQVLANAGIRGSMAGTTLRAILLRLTDDSKTFIDNFRQMGVLVTDTTGKMRPFIDILSDMARVNMTITQAGGVFTARSAAGAVALAAGLNDLKRFAYENQNAAGEAKRLADVVLNNLVGSLAYLKSSLDALFISLTAKFLPFFKTLVDLASWLVNLGAIIIGAVAPLQFLSAGILSVISVVGAFILGIGGLGIAISGLMRLVGYLAGGWEYFSGAAIKAAASATALKLAMTPLGSLINVVKAPFLALVTALGGGLVFTGIVAAITALAYVLYILATASDRARESAVKLSTESTKNIKEFDELTKSLGKTQVGTSEHERLIVELIGKYPELSGQLRLANQSWKEQQDILNNFRTKLLVDELEKGVKAITLLIIQLDRLEKKQAALRREAEAPQEVPLTEIDIGPAIQAMRRPEVIREQKETNDKIRADWATTRVIIQRELDSIDWKALGQKPLDIVTSTRGEFEKLFSSSEDSVRRITDLWASQNRTVKDQLDLLMKVTAELREQEKIKEKPIDIKDFQEAQNTIKFLLGQLNANLPADVPDEVKKQMENTVESMIIPLAELGPKVRKEVIDSFLKLLAEVKKVGSASDASFGDLLIRLQVIASKWNDIVAEMSKNVPIMNYPKNLGGVEWDKSAERFSVSGDKMSSVMTAVNIAVGKFTNTTPNMVAAIIAQESSFKQYAVSSAGALGYMQLMPTTAQLMGVEFGKTRAELEAYTTEFQKLSKGYKNGTVSLEEFNAGLEKYRQVMAPAFDVTTNIVAGTKYFSQQLANYPNQIDQIAKALAAYNAGPGKVPLLGPLDLTKFKTETQKYVPAVIELMNRMSKGVGFELYDEEKARKEVAIAKDTFQKVNTMRQSGAIATEESIAARSAALQREVYAERMEKEAALERIKRAPATMYSDLEIRKAQDALDNVRMAGEKKIREFNLEAAKERSQLTIAELELRITAAKNELSAAESTFKLHEAQADTQREILSTQLATGAKTGAEYATEAIRIQNRLYEEQLANLNRKLELDRLTAELEEKIIEAKRKSQVEEITNAQLAQSREKARLQEKKDLDDIAILLDKNRLAQEKWLQKAVEYRRELVGIGVDLVGKTAWGPIQERFASLLRNAKEFSDLGARIGKMEVPKELGPGGLIKPLEADPTMLNMMKEFQQAAQMLGSPWAQPLADIVQELVNGVSPDRFLEIRNQLQFQIVPQVKAEIDLQIKYKEQIDNVVKGITSGITDIIDAMLEGGQDLKTSAKNMFKAIFKAGIEPGIKELTQLLTNALRSLFETVGGAVASALITVVGLIGMALFSGGTSSFTPSGVQSPVTAHEAVRGVVAGETSVAIAEIGVSLQDALVSTNGILLRIEENTRGGLFGTGGANINVTIKGIEEAVNQAIEQYMRDYLMLGAH